MKFINSRHKEEKEKNTWLKILIKDKSVKLACVMVGLQNRTDKLLQANDGQLGRLFGDPYVLHPLEWVDSPDINDNEFRCFLDEVEAQLPFPQLSGLLAVCCCLRGATWPRWSWTRARGRRRTPSRRS